MLAQYLGAFLGAALVFFTYKVNACYYFIHFHLQLVNGHGYGYGHVHVNLVQQENDD